MNSSSRLRKHSVSIRGHATSFTLEDPFYEIILEIAEKRGTSIASVIAEVDSQRDRLINLSSALRLYALEWLKAQLSDRS